MSVRRINGLLYDDAEYTHAPIAGDERPTPGPLADRQYEPALPPPTRGSLAEAIVRLRSEPVSDDLADRLAWRD